MCDVWWYIPSYHHTCEQHVRDWIPEWKTNKKTRSKNKWKMESSWKTALRGVFQFLLVFECFFMLFFWLKNRMKNKLKNTAVNYPNIHHQHICFLILHVAMNITSSCIYWLSWVKYILGVFTVLILDPFLISFFISFFRKMGWKMEPEMRWKMTEKHPFFIDFSSSVFQVAEECFGIVRPLCCCPIWQSSHFVHHPHDRTSKKIKIKNFNGLKTNQ